MTSQADSCELRMHVGETPALPQTGKVADGYEATKRAGDRPAGWLVNSLDSAASPTVAITGADENRQP
ncbi:hypothetical protein [Trebonia sp.]|uniref:hypothetical protein n=1 Tax=Trebonia sp. TaxID=2767075 RepID=UPI00262B06A3|nr:hypothetical protein [Trebonia sp.]